MQDPGPYTCTSTSRTDVGMVRSINEDACLDRPDIGLWAVADGMGGHTAGDVASAMIVERLGTLAPPARLGEYVDQVEEVLLAVNRELRSIAARDQRNQTIGSTVAALVVRDGFGACLWAGDSRVYRLRDGELDQITQDHAYVEELVERGVLTRAQAVDHPQGNLVTRAVGAAEGLFVDVEIFELRPGDLFVLCSDGLDKEVEPEEIATVAREPQRRSLADALVELALSRGSRDNVTVVAVRVGGEEISQSGGPADEESEETVPGYARQPVARAGGGVDG